MIERHSCLLIHDDTFITPIIFLEKKTVIKSVQLTNFSAINSDKSIYFFCPKKHFFYVRMLFRYFAFPSNMRESTYTHFHKHMAP